MLAGTDPNVTTSVLERFDKRSSACARLLDCPEADQVGDAAMQVAVGALSSSPRTHRRFRPTPAVRLRHRFAAAEKQSARTREPRNTSHRVRQLRGQCRPSDARPAPLRDRLVRGRAHHRNRLSEHGARRPPRYRPLRAPCGGPGQGASWGGGARVVRRRRPNDIPVRMRQAHIRTGQGGIRRWTLLSGRER
jgi:hypothetical protein